MCNVYEAAPLDYLEREWKSFMEEIGDYKAILGPRDNGPFITAKRVAVGQWGMIRPGSPVRIAKDARGRPLMTNNARTERMATAPTYRDAWKHGDRCLIPALSYNEPYWGTGTNIWWKFRRADGTPWLLAGLWSEWTDRASGEVVPNYTMLTQNCDAHALLKLFHKPDPKFPLDEQDKRAVVPIERGDWEQWLSGTIEEAQALIKLPALETFAHGAADPAKNLPLPIQGA